MTYFDDKCIQLEKDLSTLEEKYAEERGELLTKALLLELENIDLRHELQEKEAFLKDNQKLRETVKTLSSRGGSRPRFYDAPPKPEVLSNYEFVKDLGTWKLSFYTPSKEECGSNTGITASSKYVSPGYSVAIDNNYWKMGTLFYIEGWGVVEARDTGSAIVGRNRADICMFNKEAAKRLGIQHRRVWLIERKETT